MRMFRRNREVSEVVEIDLGRSAEMEMLASNDAVLAASAGLSVQGSKVTSSVIHTEVKVDCSSA